MKTMKISHSDRSIGKPDHYIVESGDSVASAAEKFDLTPSHLCQINILDTHHLFAGQRLKVVIEEFESSRPREGNFDRKTDVLESQGASIPPKKCYRKIFRRMIGAELLEKSRMAKVTKADKLETNDPLAASCLKIDARFCHDLHTCVKGTLIATIETMVFSPLGVCERPIALCQSPAVMRYETIGSVAGYHDASVFVFTKRPRLQKLSTRESLNGGASSQAIPSSPHSEENISEVQLKENEVFLCCTLQRNRLTSGDPTSPTIPAPGAQWFIVTVKSLEELNNFLIGCDLGFASVLPMGAPPIKPAFEKTEPEREKARSIPAAIGSLIPRRMTRHLRGDDGSSGTYPQGYIYRSLGRLMQCTSSAKRTTPRAVLESGHQKRQLSVSCSEELFSGHAAVALDAMGKKSGGCGDVSESLFFNKSPSSTPSFADEKEVFDMLRQASLIWELVNEQEFLQRCVLAEEQEKAQRKVESEPSEDPLGTFALLPPPTPLLQSLILTTETQIQELFFAIPMSAQCLEWSLTYSTELHGFNLTTLYRRCEAFMNGDSSTPYDHDRNLTIADLEDRMVFSRLTGSVSRSQNQPCVLLIRDTRDYLMGAYLSCHPQPNKSSTFFGTGESFVFHWTKNTTPSPCVEDILAEANPGAPFTSSGSCFKKYEWSKKNSFIIFADHDVLLVGCSNGMSALRMDDCLNKGRSDACETFDSPALTPHEDFCIHTLELWSLS